ncbi:uncharacterized protein MELLADRAFT_93574 [Melampsora larici-populina 98AG31]|uniref:Ketoreductase (KR) domain-containing protein n=1 Tax=Melampsora larici-populina (strain 98AG31 / pathotype 3-4-7) TaxID=747676 RepID=F4RAW9_MELLP|nr:uncharacterized protein MELLADRAFT_93574 [Melampsora larici-populina 98AG31]EGG10548.1 hypothetical protein MELLADRAFT_93574 [Melampsora larici-populina 98AG31]
MRFFWDIRPLTANPSDSDVHHYECDISDAKAVEAVADRVKNEVGDPTIIINNVEVANGTFIIDLNPSEIQRFGVNIMAHFHLLKAFLPTLIELKNGYIVSTISIVNLDIITKLIAIICFYLFLSSQVTVASILGTFGVCQASDYCTSKAAVLSLHESLELDCRFLNILIPTVSFFIE